MEHLIFNYLPDYYPNLNEWFSGPMPGPRGGMNRNRRKIGNKTYLRRRRGSR